jgi:predicted transcriptional regulator of viral defense system
LGAPETQWTPYMKAVLWPNGAIGVLSHETALGLMDLSDVNPSRIHITVPLDHRNRRRVPPPGVQLHRADLLPEEVGSIEGLPVTTAARTIRDCAAAHIGPALLRQALDDAARSGWLSAQAAEELRIELIRDGKLK